MRPVAMQASILRHSFARQAFTQQRAVASKRLMSSSTEATQKKAQDALAAAQKNAGKFLDSAKKFLEPLGDKVGQLLGCKCQTSTPLYFIRSRTPPPLLML